MFAEETPSRLQPAARMIEMMEHQGIVGASECKPREVLGKKIPKERMPAH